MRSRNLARLSSNLGRFNSSSTTRGRGRVSIGTLAGLLLAAMVLFGYAVAAAPRLSRRAVVTLPDAPPETEAESCDGVMDGPGQPADVANDCAGAKPPGSELPTGPGAPNPGSPGGPSVPNPTTPGHGGPTTPMPGPAQPRTRHLGDGHTLAKPGTKGGAPGVQHEAVSVRAAPSGGEIPVAEVLKRGRLVDIKSVSLHWTEQDGNYPSLPILRSYVSNLTEEPDVLGSIGSRWFHDFQERLEILGSIGFPGGGGGFGQNSQSQYQSNSMSQIPIGSIVHRSIEQPNVNHDLAYLNLGGGTYQGPAHLGRTLETGSAVQWSGAAYKLTYRDGRVHYFKDDGRILARVGPSGLDAIQFEYNGTNDALSAVVDVAGQVFEVESDVSGQFMTAIVDPAGQRIEYDVDTTAQLLLGVEYPTQDVHINGFDTQGDPVVTPWTTVTTRTTTRTYTYNVDDRLDGVVADSQNADLSVLYQVDDPSNSSPDESTPWIAVDARGGQWEFEVNGTLRTVTDPRGFQRDYLVDANGDVTRIREYFASTDTNVPSRATSGYREWTITRNATCDCGKIDAILEPDGTGWEFTYDADFNTEQIDRVPNDSSSDRLTTIWTYDTQGRIQTVAGPEANAATVPADYTYTRTYTTLPSNDPVAPNGLELVITTPAGGLHSVDPTWTYRYDTRRRLVEYEGPRLDGAQLGVYAFYEYYPSGVGANSHRVKRWYSQRDLSVWSEYSYDTCGRLAQTVTSSGLTLSQSFDGAGRLTQWVGPNRGSQQYVLQRLYNGDGQVSAVRYRYYDRGPSASGTDSYTWVETSFWYDDAGQLVCVQDDVDANTRAEHRYAYDASGNLNDYTDPDGQRFFTLFDERSLQWKLYSAYGTAAEIHSEAEYSPIGLLSSWSYEVDGQTFVQNSLFDKFGRLYALDVPGQNLVETELDAAGRIVMLDNYGRSSGQLRLLSRELTEYADWHDGATSRTHHTYDETGSSLVQSTDAEIAYTASGHPETVTVDGSVLARFEYTERGEIQRVYDDLGSEEEIIRDSATNYVVGHTLTQIDPIHSTSQLIQREFERDAAGRCTKAHYLAAGQSTLTETFEYDSLDNVVKFIDTKGVVTKREFRYDGAPTVVRGDYNATTNTSASTEQYGYSPSGRMEYVTDNRQNSTTWLYDELGRVYREIQPDATFWQWTFNEAGALKQAVTPTGKVLDFTYNLRGQPTGRTVKASSSGPVLRTDVYDWTMSGHLKEATKTEGSQVTSTEFVRDGDGRVLSETTDGRTVQFYRDSEGRVTQIAGPSSLQNYTYDHYNRVATVKDSTNASIGTLYYFGPGHALSRLLLGDGTRTDVLRDGFGRVESSTTRKSGNIKFEYGYTWDDDGTLLAEYRNHDGEGDGFAYDNLKRLTKFVRASDDPLAELATPGSTTHDRTVEYDLDADSHRESVTTTPYLGSPSTTSYSTFTDRNHYSAVGAASRTMSDDGNLLTSGTRSFTYDAMDNLATVTDGSTLVATYTYDALDRRLTKQVGTVTTTFVNAGPWVVEELQSTSGGSPVLVASHFHSGGIDDVLMSRRVDVADLDRDNNTTEYIDLYLHKNRQGSVMEITLSNGTVVESYRYDAYGAPTIYDRSGQVVSAPPSGNRYLFTGREFDSETGLYHYRARAYDPATGAFLQEDPLGLADGLNPVAYVAANPVTSSDPMGMASVTETLKSIAEFAADNADILVDLLLDIFTPLGALIDAIEAATGYSIRGWIASGFKELAELSIWDRVCAGASALAAVGGAVAILAKLDDIIDKIRGVIKRAQEMGKKVVVKTGQALGIDCPFGLACFARGTPVLLACGALVPIEMIELGDLVACEQMGEVEDANRLVAEELGISGPDDALTCGQVVLDAANGVTVDVTLLRSQSWWDAATLDGGLVALQLPELGVSGIGELVRTWEFEKPLDFGTCEARPVTALIRTSSAPVLELELSTGETISVTGRHPFWSEARDAWVPAADLRRNEALAAELCEGASVVAVHGRSDRAPVFNLEVSAAHTFRVTGVGVLVHNTCPGRPGSRGGPAHQATVDRRIQELKDQGHDLVGGGPETETTIQTPGGSKSRRRPDIHTTDPDGNDYYENVGRANQDGSPVARERRALDDIENATGTRPKFTPYNQ